ncbi:MAG TPA: hypothetical protein VFM18_11650 [Methanosarcina sp.]|nr:hypothetical protein [Methanosarcina sp.]
MAQYRVVDKVGFVKFEMSAVYANQIFREADGFLSEKFGKGTFEITCGCSLNLKEIDVKLVFNQGDCLVPII